FLSTPKQHGCTNRLCLLQRRIVCVRLLVLEIREPHPENLGFKPPGFHTQQIFPHRKVKRNQVIDSRPTDCRSKPVRLCEDKTCLIPSKGCTHQAYGTWVGYSHPHGFVHSGHY